MRKARNTLGSDPLAALLSDPPASPVSATPEAGGVGERATTRPRFTVRIAEELQERVRDAAYWERATVTAIVERALAAELERMEQARGEAYQPRTEELRPGRPVGGR